MSHRSSVSMSWRLAKHRYGLSGSLCACGEAFFPPRAVCGCGHETKPFKFSGQGKILSYTIIHTAPEGFEKMTPYAIALVKLEEGPVVSAQIVGNNEEVEIGKSVSTVFRRLSEDGPSGIINYGIKFEILDY